MFLEILWFAVVVGCVAAYAMLDGFDLGVGMLHLFVKKDEERRIFLNAIGPIWDGNEVWLVVLVGGLFAGFPCAYATLMTAFYMPITVLIFGLIFRAVAIEFRSKKESRLWRGTWDLLFSLGSFMIALLIALSLGNMIHGIPLDENHRYVGDGLLSFFNPYVFVVAGLALALFIMHGILFLVMKTTGELQERLKRWVTPVVIVFALLYVATTMTTLIFEPHMTAHFRERPYLFLVALASLVTVANIPRSVHQNKTGMAFLSSSATIGLLLLLFALGIFPDLIHSSVNPETHSLTIFNAAASEKTLMILAIIVAIGIPLVIAYGVFIYRLFSGKVDIDHMSY